MHSFYASFAASDLLFLLAADVLPLMFGVLCNFLSFLLFCLSFRVSLKQRDLILGNRNEKYEKCNTRWKITQQEWTWDGDDRNFINLTSNESLSWESFKQKILRSFSPLFHIFYFNRHFENASNNLRMCTFVSSECEDEWRDSLKFCSNTSSLKRVVIISSNNIFLLSRIFNIKKRGTVKLTSKVFIHVLAVLSIFRLTSINALTLCTSLFLKMPFYD